MKETHKTRLLNYLKEFGSITSLEAIRDLGNTRLADTIFRLKKEGFNIISEDKRVQTRFKKQNGDSIYTQVSNYKLLD